MQNSEIYRRGFVVPLNEDAEQALIANDVTYNTAVDFYEFPNNGVFESVWETGLFDEINAQLGTMLDDYEEDVIVNDQILILREVASSFKKIREGPFSEKKAITELIRLCDVALKHNTSIFFVF